jgi:oligopeptidase A
MNSLLSTSFPERALGLPQFERFDASEVPAAISELLSRYDSAIATVTSHAATHAQQDAAALYATVATVLEQADDDLSAAFGTVQHLHRVCDAPELRDVYGPALERVTEHGSALMQNRALFEAIARIERAPGFAQLPVAQRTAIEHWLRDFRLGGVALDGAPAQRFRDIAQRLSQLSAEFEEALLDATEAWNKQCSAAELDGVPVDAMARFQAAAASAGAPADSFQISLDYPSYSAVMTYAHNRTLRAELYMAYGTRASELNADATSADNTASDNGPRIAEMLALKLESAELLGFANSASESLATKMAASPERVMGFLNDLLARARPAAAREIADVSAFAQTLGHIGALEPWDLSYYSEKLKAKVLGFDDEALRPYLAYPQVLEGLFTVLARVFGLTVRAAQASVWHSDVGYFELLRGGVVIASCYIDPFARPKKRSGAWMDVCRSQRRANGKHRHPVAYLVCNFAPPAADGATPALLTHDDVVTLFHEFGHGLHHMLSEIDTPAVGGIEGVEWDAVELPSQFLENFCWQAAALDLLSQHHLSGAPLPAELKAKLLASRQFQSGLFLVRQLEMALFDFTIHLRTPAPTLSEVMAILSAVRAQTSVLKPPAWQRFPHSFSHIFGGGYAAGYYSYLWAEVLSSDAFAAFPPGAAFDRSCGERFRREVLSVGGSRPALESFIAFRGREPDVSALLQSYGLAS